MAYATSLKFSCARCHSKQAVVEIFNNVNATLGKYCNKCGKIVCDRQNAIEKEMFKAQQTHNSRSTSGGAQ